MATTRIVAFGEQVLFCGRSTVRMMRLSENTLLPVVNCVEIAQRDLKEDIVDVAVSEGVIFVLSQQNVYQLDEKCDIAVCYALPASIAPVSLSFDRDLVSWTDIQRLSFARSQTVYGAFNRFNRRNYTANDDTICIDSTNYELFRRDVRDCFQLIDVYVVVYDYHVQILPIEFVFTKSSTADNYRRFGRVIQFSQFICCAAKRGNSVLFVLDSAMMLFRAEVTGSRLLIDKETQLFDSTVEIQVVQQQFSGTRFESAVVQGDLAIVLQQEQIAFYRIEQISMEQLKIAGVRDNLIEIADAENGEFMHLLNSADNICFACNANLLAQNAIITYDRQKLKLFNLRQKQDSLLQHQFDAKNQLKTKCNVYACVGSLVYFSLNHLLFKMENRTIVPVETDFAQRSQLIAKRADNMFEIAYYRIERENLVPEECKALTKINQFLVCNADRALEIVIQDRVYRLEFQHDIQHLCGDLLTINDGVYEISISLLEDVPALSLLFLYKNQFANQLWARAGNAFLTNDEFNPQLLVIQQAGQRKQIILESEIQNFYCIDQNCFVACKQHAFVYKSLENTVKQLLRGNFEIWQSNSVILAENTQTGRIYQFANAEFVETQMYHAQNLDFSVYAQFCKNNTVEVLHCDITYRWNKVAEIDIPGAAYAVQREKVYVQDVNGVCSFLAQNSEIKQLERRVGARLLGNACMLENLEIVDLKTGVKHAVDQQLSRQLLFAEVAPPSFIAVSNDYVTLISDQTCAFKMSTSQEAVCQFASPYLVVHQQYMFQVLKTTLTGIENLGQLKLPKMAIKNFLVVSNARNRRYFLIVQEKFGRLMRIDANEAFGVADVRILSDKAYSAVQLYKNVLMCLTFDGLIDQLSI